MIGAPAYIECSAKTQQVNVFNLVFTLHVWSYWQNLIFLQQNVKAVFDAAIKVVLQPPKNKKRKKRKSQKACSILWFNRDRRTNRRIEELHLFVFLKKGGIVFKKIRSSTKYLYYCLFAFWSVNIPLNTLFLCFLDSHEWFRDYSPIKVFMRFQPLYSA